MRRELVQEHAVGRRVTGETLQHQVSEALADRVQPLWVSDHLCWTGIEGFNSHDLLALPYTEYAMRVVCANILFAQDVLERPLLLENPSTYMSFADDRAHAAARQRAA
jgi:uncharacterized protein (UPF0276 family)